MEQHVYVSIDDAARLLGVDRRTVLRLILERALPSARFGLERRVLLSAATAMLQNTTLNGSARLG